jgi:hypothetical protein
MNFKRHFISIMIILCALSVSCFGSLKAVAVSGGEESSLVVADNNEVFSAGDDDYGPVILLKKS